MRKIPSLLLAAILLVALTGPVLAQEPTDDVRRPAISEAIDSVLGWLSGLVESVQSAAEHGPLIDPYGPPEHGPVPDPHGSTQEAGGEEGGDGLPEHGPVIDPYG